MGLILFILYFYKVVAICMSRFSEYRLLFAALLLLNYIVWFKVASDLFVLFALFLCVPGEEEDVEGVEGTIGAKGIDV